MVDVRGADEWEAGHAPGALHLPLHDLPARVNTLPDGELHLVCRVGGRSLQAARWLAAHGRDAVNVEGGMRRWVEQGLPLVRDDGGPAAVV